MLFGGDVFIEAKLTEVDFTDSPLEHVLRYRDFQSVFDTTLLPRSGSRLHHYQLVRNVLAASAHDRRCTLFCDARRPDLIRSWWTVVRAIREGALRARCGLVLWQELVAAAPDRLKSFLAVKYGFEV
jgi:hypothetical protein